MYILFLTIVLIWFVGINPLIGTLRKGKMPLDSPLTEKERIKYYTKTISLLWASAIVALTLCLLTNISFFGIGLRGISLNQNIWFTSATLVLSPFT